MVGEVVIAPISYTDLRQNKKRPAVIVAEVGMDDYIVCTITTQGSSESEYIPIEAADMASGVLDEESWARTNRLHTLNEEVLTRIGALTDAKTDEIRAAIRRLF